MASRTFNSKSPTIKRILREASELTLSPSPDYAASPASDSDLFEWHFTLRGPPSSPFSSGLYHGRIVLPPTYPLRPPSFRFLTPSGRFETNREICLSISGHHEDTWQPAWGIRTALVALRSFMETDPKGQLGGLECSDDVRRRMAVESASWKCGTCGKSNEKILRECEAAAKEKESEEGSRRKEKEVPKELKFGFKDEKKVEEVVETSVDGTQSSAELAEGFVQTGPRPGPVFDGQVRTPTAAYPQARPAQGVPQATGASRPSEIGAIPPQARLVPQRRSNDGVPTWVDRAIAGLVICLVLMVMKVLLGF